MKRIVILCLSLALLLCACQPTPEEEYVVGKAPIASARVESATDSTESTPAPTFYADSVAVNKGALTDIRFDATLENFDVGLWPVCPLTPVSFDAETADRLIRAFAPDTRISVGEGSMTVQDIEAEISQTLTNINNVDTKKFESEADKAEYLQEEQQILAELQEAYRSAQNVTVAFVEAGALTEPEKVSFRLIDAAGKTVAKGTIRCGIEAGDPRASLFRLASTDDSVPLDSEGQDIADLQAICDAFLQEAGIEGFAYADAGTRGLLSELDYTRSVGALPYAAAYGITALQWRDYDSGELFPEPSWSDESITMLCKNGRVASIEWLSKSNVGDAVQEVPILPFSDLSARIVNGLTYQWSMPLDETEESHRIEISRIQIGMKRVPVYGAVRQYQLIPVCTVIGRFVQKYRSPSDNTQVILDANNEWYGSDGILLVISAIDGSIVG